MRHALHCRQLDDMIWAPTTSTAAPELGISDLALRNQCVKHVISCRVPLPEVGSL